MRSDIHEGLRGSPGLDPREGCGPGPNRHERCARRESLATIWLLFGARRASLLVHLELQGAASDLSGSHERCIARSRDVVYVFPPFLFHSFLATCL